MAAGVNQCSYLQSASIPHVLLENEAAAKIGFYSPFLFDFCDAIAALD
jgi:hypothetical protein